MSNRTYSFYQIFIRKGVYLIQIYSSTPTGLMVETVIPIRSRTEVRRRVTSPGSDRVSETFQPPFWPPQCRECTSSKKGSKPACTRRWPQLDVLWRRLRLAYLFEDEPLVAVLYVEIVSKIILGDDPLDPVSVVVDETDRVAPDLCILEHRFRVFESLVCSHPIVVNKASHCGVDIQSRRGQCFRGSSKQEGDRFV